MDCNGFWNHTPPRADKDGVWVDSQVAIAPTLQRRAQEPGAGIGRCRVIELQPNEYADAIYNLHQDDNNRLNEEGTGWVVRGFFNLSDDTESHADLRADRFDPATEIRLPLRAGSRIIVDTQALLARGLAPRHGAALRAHHVLDQAARSSTRTSPRTTATRTRPRLTSTRSSSTPPRSSCTGASRSAVARSKRRAS